MKKLVLICAMLTLLTDSSLLAADKPKAKKAPKKAAKLEEWYMYRYVYFNGSKVTRFSACEKAAKSPGERAEFYDARGLDYQMVDQLSSGDTPLVVDFITDQSYTKAGYDYAYRSVQIIVDRYIRGEKLCQKIVSADKNGELDTARYDRYR